MKERDPKVGSDRGITRREFFDGACKTIGAVALASAAANGTRIPTAAAAGSAPVSSAVKSVPEPYPPSLQGIRGQTQPALEVAHAMRDGAAFPEGEDTGEQYDLVVVGAGMSGLAAAYYYRKALPSAKILILDNCDDFGGHARRNEFDVAGRRLIGVGGTYTIMFPGTYTPEGKALLADIGVNAGRYFAATASDEQRYGGLDRNIALFFDKETFGKDRLVDGYPEFMPFLSRTPAGANRTGSTAAEWRHFLARAPLSGRAKQDVLRIVGEIHDYMPGTSLSEKIYRLQAISYTDYLSKMIGVSEETTRFLRNLVGGFVLNVGAGPDSLSAWMAYQSECPGFQGMGLPPLRLSGVVSDEQAGEDIHFPDGNAGVARLLVRWLIPQALAGSTMEDSVLAHLDYSALDRAGSEVRIRLGSTVIRARHSGPAISSEDVTVSYVRDGQVFRVRGKTCVMACFNAIVPYLCPELPELQKEALKLAVRKPLVWATIALRNWKAFAALRTGVIYSPGSFYHLSLLDIGSSLGNYGIARSADEPAILYMGMAPNVPGLSARDQYRASRAQLQGIDRETYERHAKTQLQHMLGKGGFDSDRDIAGITINRWAHGYACGGNDLYDPPLSGAEPAWVRARRRFGRIAVANSDAAGISMTQAAFDQANRAVRELLSDVVRPQFYFRNPEQA